MSLTIYHNPRCSKSRKSLELIQESGIEAVIVDYQQEPPNADTLRRLAVLLGVPLADLLRRGESEFKDATDLPDLDDEPSLAGWIEANPKTLQRPIVVDEAREKAVIGRPPENVLELIRE